MLGGSNHFRDGTFLVSITGEEVPSVCLGPGTAGVEGVAGREAGGGEDAGELVGEDGDVDAGAAGDEAEGLGGRGGGCGETYASTDLLGDRVVLVGAEILDVDAEGAEVGDGGVLDGRAEAVCSGYDLEVAVGGGVLSHKPAVVWCGL
ncbi:hypothetical protein RJ640_005434 [Escallonia rubra]|uniref:Uncharacterized protein n=1 Tax=Escallonia rubra TaxID=112253 RepID=A0AA88QP85_9ASTE|nr:hypothetical protein RJ640_005434 [Escallonia rubra]